MVHLYYTCIFSLSRIVSLIIINKYLINFHRCFNNGHRLETFLFSFVSTFGEFLKRSIWFGKVLSGYSIVRLFHRFFGGQVYNKVSPCPSKTWPWEFNLIQQAEVTGNGRHCDAEFCVTWCWDCIYFLLYKSILIWLIRFKWSIWHFDF